MDGPWRPLEGVRKGWGSSLMTTSMCGCRLMYVARFRLLWSMVIAFRGPNGRHVPIRVRAVIRSARVHFSRPYCHLRSNIYLVCSPATTGGWGWAYGYRFHWRGDFKGVYSSSSLLWQGGSADVIELYSLCRTSWERLSSESRVYLSGVEVLLIMCYRLLTPMFNDSHPCVRYTACQSV